MLKIITLLTSLLFGILGIPQMFPEILKLSVVSRILITLTPPLVIGIIILFVSTYSIWIKIIQKINKQLARILFYLIFHPYAKVSYLALVLIAIVFVSNFNYSVIALSITASIIFLSSLKQFPLQEYKEEDDKEIIFDDDFVNNRGWFLNYWGTTNPSKTNRIENSMMIFEAEEEELLSTKKEFGAYIDLKNGIRESVTYEIHCKVKSDINTTMGFQIWVHDTLGGNPAVSVKEPSHFYLPDRNYKTIKLRYRANSTNAIRIHLHNKGGKGKILVDKITVYRLDLES